MPTTNKPSVLFALATMFAAVNLSAQQETKPKTTALEGVWIVQSVEREGKQVILPSNTMVAGGPNDPPRYLPREARLIAKGNKITRRGWANRDGTDELIQDFEIDSTTTPKALLFKEGGKVINTAVYDLVGDTLRLAFALPPADRPKTISSESGTLWVLRRAN
jgi:uncharacterized protein (TIGR03067 family)